MFRRSESGQSWGWLATVLAVIAVIIFIIWNVMTLHRVNPGYVGVVVHYNRPGATAGRPVLEEVPTGKWVRISWLYDKIAQYPISQQTLTMVRASEEGDVTGDDSVKCQDKNGVPLNVDSSTLWRVDPEHAGDLYILRPDVDLTGRQGSDIASLVVRREIRFAITTACSFFTYDGVYGADKQAFTTKVNDLLGESLAQSYILLDNFLTGEIHLEKQQEDAILAKSVAQQQAQQAAFLAEQRKNEAAGAIAKAEGEKQVAILAAEGQAEAIRIVSEQLAANPDYIRYLYATKWDGKLPVVLFVGGSAENFPIIELPEGLITPPDQPTPQ